MFALWAAACAISTAASALSTWARALATRAFRSLDSMHPRIILVDAPTAALDSQRARIVMDLPRRVATEQRAAIITVTHDEKILDRFDRIFQLRASALEDGASTSAAAWACRMLVPGPGKGNLKEMSSCASSFRAPLRLDGSAGGPHRIEKHTTKGA